MIVQVLNPQDKPYCKHAYHITIGVHCSFEGIVFADCLSDALDLIIDSWEETENDNPGYFLSEDDLSDSDFTEEDYITGGNHGRVTSFGNYELQAVEYRSNDINLIASIDN